MECDQSWDFDAPQFVDFCNAKSLPDDEEAESYFDFDHENGVPVNLNGSADFLDTFQTPKTEFTRTTRSSAKKAKEKSETPLRNTRPKTPKASDQEKSKENITPQSQNILAKKSLSTSKLPDVKAIQTKPANLCTDLEAWKKKTAGPNKNTLSGNVKTEPLQKPGTKRQNRSLERSNSVSKKPRENVPSRGTTPAKKSGLQRSCSFNSLGAQAAERAQRNHHRQPSRDRSSSQKRAGSAERNDSGKTKQLTVATTPTCMKRKPVKMVQLQPVKKTEDLEMEKIEFYRQELAKKKKMAQESYKLAMQGKAPTTTTHHKDVTKPQEFHFETDRRVKTHGMETRQDMDVKDFASVLRSNKDKAGVSGPIKSGPTKPEPFHFSSQRKRKLPDLDAKQAEKYESMAQKLAHFNATPERFRSRPKTAAPQTRGRSRSPPNQGITVPKTPQFETKTRSRPVTAPTREELEDKEVEELKKHQFKTNPVNPKIFTNPSLGVKKVPRKPPTVPEGFNLSSDKRALEKDDRNHDDEHFEFHAQPLNKKILEGVVGVKEAKRLPPTVPESPAFALKHRARVPVVESQEKEEKHNLRSRAAPHFGVPFQPQYQHKITEPAPFGFEEREKIKAELKAQKIEQALEEEARMREFYANPMPDLEPHLPAKKTRALTVQQPFNLGTETRGMKKAEEWSHKLEEELRQQKEKVRFKAREPHVLESEPFIPAKANKFTTEFSEFEMNTAKRLVKREAFEMYKKTRQDELDNIRKQEQKMKEAEEHAELERLRQEAVPRANPVKHYKPVQVHSSSKPLTEAMSPRFKTDERLRFRAHLSQSVNSSVSST